MEDINGITIEVGDRVHCWDGKLDKSEITVSLRGVVSIREGDWCVGNNPLALVCAEYVEVVSKDET